MKNYNQLCVWPATVIGKDQVANFEKFMLKEMKVRVKYDSEQITNPDPEDSSTGGRNDAFFYVHKDDVGKFAIPRLSMGIRWWEDVLLNNNEYLYSEDFIKSHPKTW